MEESRRLLTHQLAVRERKEKGLKLVSPVGSKKRKNSKAKVKTTKKTKVKVKGHGKNQIKDGNDCDDHDASTSSGAHSEDTSSVGKKTGQGGRKKRGSLIKRKRRGSGASGVKSLSLSQSHKIKKSDSSKSGRSNGTSSAANEDDNEHGFHFEPSHYCIFSEADKRFWIRQDLWKRKRVYIGELNAHTDAMVKYIQEHTEGVSAIREMLHGQSRSDDNTAAQSSTQAHDENSSPNSSLSGPSAPSAPSSPLSLSGAERKKHARREFLKLYTVPTFFFMKSFASMKKLIESAIIHVTYKQKKSMGSEKPIFSVTRSAADNSPRLSTQSPATLARSFRVSTSPRTGAGNKQLGEMGTDTTDTTVKTVPHPRMSSQTETQMNVDPNVESRLRMNLNDRAMNLVDLSME